MTALWSDLVAVRSALASTTDDAAALADAVGHSALAARVREFSTTWDDLRDDLAESVGDLAEAALQIDDAFGATDADLQASLLGADR
jgi:uncharacterized membrane protein YccC